MALDLIPSSSSKVAILLMPVSSRRLQTSGGNLGTDLPSAIRMKDIITMQMPRAVNQTRSKMKKAETLTRQPDINRTSPDKV